MEMGAEMAMKMELEMEMWLWLWLWLWRGLGWGLGQGLGLGLAIAMAMAMLTRSEQDRMRVAALATRLATWRLATKAPAQLRGSVPMQQAPAVIGRPPSFRRADSRGRAVRRPCRLRASARSPSGPRTERLAVPVQRSMKPRLGRSRRRRP